MKQVHFRHILIHDKSGEIFHFIEATTKPRNSEQFKMDCIRGFYEEGRNSGVYSVGCICDHIDIQPLFKAYCTRNQATDIKKVLVNSERFQHGTLVLNK